MKHTPAPWKFSLSITGDGHKIWTVDKDISRGVKQEICRSYDLNDESLSNAYLIATAPELLKALEVVLSYITLSDISEEVYENALDVIAKAKNG